MSDNGGGKKTPYRMEILMSPDGGMQVQGPGNGKLFDIPICLWLLENAKDYVKFVNAKVMAEKAQSNLVVPQPMRRRM